MNNLKTGRKTVKSEDFSGASDMKNGKAELGKQMKIFNDLITQKVDEDTETGALIYNKSNGQYSRFECWNDDLEGGDVLVYNGSEYRRGDKSIDSSWMLVEIVNRSPVECNKCDYIFPNDEFEKDTCIYCLLEEAKIDLEASDEIQYELTKQQKMDLQKKIERLEEKESAGLIRIRLLKDGRIRQAWSSNNSVVLNLSGYIKPDKYYKMENCSETVKGQLKEVIKLTEVEINIKEPYSEFDIDK